MNSKTAAGASGVTDWQDVMRIVFPLDDTGDTDSLYVIPWTRPLTSASAFDEETKRKENAKTIRMMIDRFEVIQDAKPEPVRENDNCYEVLSRESLSIKKGRRVSFSTFFNAFPAAYWFRWTNINNVKLSLQFKPGEAGEVFVYKSTNRGRISDVASAKTGADGKVEVEIPLVSFIDGGYIWFDVAASRKGDLTLESASWAVPAEFSRRADDTKKQGTFSIAITTFNRASYCAAQLERLAEAPKTLEFIDYIYVVDQGTDYVEWQPTFADSKKKLGDKLQYIHQANLGGSGGFSRGMFETLRNGKSDAVLLLDDDAISEPESILRASQFADFTKKPTIVGGGMFHLDDKQVLYTAGEIYDEYNVWMGAAAGSGYDHNYGRDPMREVPALHKRFDADYNGWWMCFIPREVLEEVGLSMPVFIKFDDTEHCVRAGEAGYPTVCLPGVALWHMAWHDKDPGRTWEEYFFFRNRLLCGLLHSKSKKGGSLPYVSLVYALKDGLKMQYSAVEARFRAFEDIFKGPDYISSSIGKKLLEIRNLKKEYDDGAVKPSLSDFPEVSNKTKDGRWRKLPSRPTSKPSTAFHAFGAFMKHFFLPPSAKAMKQPQSEIQGKDTRWWRMASSDSLLVTMPDGSGVAWYKRDPKEFRRIVTRQIFYSLKFRFQFRKLAKIYRESDFASLENWEKIFERENKDLKVLSEPVKAKTQAKKSAKPVEKK